MDPAKPLSPSRPSSFRIGLTDPQGPLSRHVRDVFHASDLPVSRFVPIGVETDAGKLYEIDGETEIFVPPARETIADLDFLVIAGSPIDATARALAGENEVPVFEAAAVPAAALGCDVILSAAPPVSAAFTLILPAAEEGTEGIQELFRQAGDALNFRDTRAPIFGNRLAFNLFRDGRTAALDRRIEACLRERHPDAAVSATSIRGTLLHGYGASARLVFADAGKALEAADRLRASRDVGVGKKPGAASPAVVVEDSKMAADPPEVDGAALSLWFAFDGLALCAEAALAAARVRLR